MSSGVISLHLRMLGGIWNYQDGVYAALAREGFMVPFKSYVRFSRSAIYRGLMYD